MAPLLLSLFVCLAAPLGAQEAKSGSAKLDAVVVSGSAKFQSAQIASVTGLKPGDQVTRDDIQKGADALANFGPFSKVQYRFSTTDSGVRVEYIVADAPSVPAMFDNFPWFTDDQLIAAIKASVPLFDGTAPERGSILDDISNVLSRDLVAHGVVANVSHELITLPNGRQVLMFHAEGPSVNVQEIQFSDPLASSDPAIHDRIADLIGKPFSREAIRLFELEQVRPIYLQHAFLRVKFGELNAKVDGNKVVVQAPIDPGPAFTWSGVKWSGNTALASTDLDKLVQLNDGGAADGMKILATWENVRNAFSRHGFLDFTMDPEPSFDDAAKRVRYSVKITEGTQYHMGKLVLTGLSMEGERRIRAGWKLAPGAVFDEQAFNDFVDSGAKEAFGNLPVHYEKIGRFLQKDPTTGKVDVMLDFQ
ncbi:MAG TPA: POTRA domain-containing protein [Candidatus Limnocylindrales bacterium]|nr:POTRA domain-containing protein [Candidatus Limnocylindrales bacterium]